MLLFGVQCFKIYVYIIKRKCVLIQYTIHIYIEVRIAAFYVYKPDSRSIYKWGCSSGVERALRMREAPGSIPGISTFCSIKFYFN